MKTLKLFSRCEQNKTALLGATILIGVCGWMTGCATLPAEGAGSDQEAASSADQVADSDEMKTPALKKSDSTASLVDEKSQAASNTNLSKVNGTIKEEAADKIEPRAEAQVAQGDADKAEKRAEQAVVPKVAKTFTITVTKSTAENVQMQVQSAANTSSAVQVTDTPVAKNELVNSISTEAVKDEEKVEPPPEAVKAKKKKEVEVPQPVAESEQAVVASQSVQTVEVSKDVADEIAQQSKTMTESAEKPAVKKAEKKAKVTSAPITTQERPPVQYQCEAQQCPRADLKEIKIDLMGETPKLITPSLTGLITKSQWTRLGTVLDVEWQDAAGAKKLEKLTMDVLDTKHLTLKDEQGKINRYMIIEEAKAEPAAAAQP